MKKFLTCAGSTNRWKMPCPPGLAGWLMVFSILPGFAADITWNVSSPGANWTWGTASNWTPAMVPGSGDTAIFGSAVVGNQQMIVGTQSIASLRFENALGIQLRIGTLTFDANGVIEMNTSSLNVIQPTVNLVLTNGLTATNTGGTLGLHGIISGNGNLTVNASGAAVVQVLNANTYSGTTFLQSGTGGGISINTDTPFSSGTVITGTQGVTISSIGSQLANTFVLNGDLKYFELLTGGLTGNISGAGKFTKIGGGTLILSGSNTYSGGTFVSSGTLLVNGLVSGTATVEQTGTLGGTGTITGDTTVAGILAPGVSLGSINFGGALFMEGTAQIQMELASLVNFDRALISGLLTYDGILSINLLGGYLPQVGDSFDLFDAGSVTAGSDFDDIVFNVTGVAAVFDPNTGILTFTAVPEPSAALLMLTGGVLALGVRRRTRAVHGSSGEPLSPLAGR